MAYAPEYEKELPNRSHRRRMGSNRAPRSGARGARTTEDPRPAQDPRRRFYILKSGYSWRLLPREFPPWETVYLGSGDGGWTAPSSGSTRRYVRGSGFARAGIRSRA